MELNNLWELTKSAQSLIIVHPSILTDLSQTDFALIEEELILSSSFCAGLYQKALKSIKSYRKSKNFTEDLKILLDFGVLINGELGMAWTIKYENFSNLIIPHEIHINTLSIKLHRKAAVAWEFRKNLISLCFPTNELETIKNLQEIHKQNYYLWEYKRWLFSNQLSVETQKEDYEEMLHYCSGHPSDSSAFHYLSYISSVLGVNDRTYEWVCDLCSKFYGRDGFYNEQCPVGFETLCLLRAKSRKLAAEDLGFFQEQQSLNRNIRYLYMHRS